MAPIINTTGQQWHVGLAQVDITPEEPVRMGGYAGRTTPSQGVLDPLLAKAMVVEWSEGERGVIITTDLVGVDADFAAVVCDDIKKATGLERRQIIINYSHTHAGPIFGMRYLQCWEASNDELDVISRFDVELRRVSPSTDLDVLLLGEALGDVFAQEVGQAHPCR